ncbi:unnamed protein product [Arctogadus glacialis]
MQGPWTPPTSLQRLVFPLWSWDFYFGSDSHYRLQDKASASPKPPGPSRGAHCAPSAAAEQPTALAAPHGGGRAARGSSPGLSLALGFSISFYTNPPPPHPGQPATGLENKNTD